MTLVKPQPPTRSCVDLYASETGGDSGGNWYDGHLFDPATVGYASPEQLLNIGGSFGAVLRALEPFFGSVLPAPLADEIARTPLTAPTVASEFSQDFMIASDTHMYSSFLHQDGTEISGVPGVGFAMNMLSLTQFTPDMNGSLWSLIVMDQTAFGGAGDTIRFSGFNVLSNPHGGDSNDHVEALYLFGQVPDDVNALFDPWQNAAEAADPTAAVIVYGR